MIQIINENIAKDNFMFANWEFIEENMKVIFDELKNENYLADLDKEKALNLADEIIKNTYRTLLTRGQKGCYIYCEDKELAQFLKSKLKRYNGITYPIGDEINCELMVAEDSEDYRYE